MTRIRIDPGACGLITVVEVDKSGGKKYSVRIGSDCEMVVRLGLEISELGMQDAFKKILDSPVYRGASICLRHVSCPVPCGILKALEVEAALAVPKAASITFLEEEGQTYGKDT